MRITTLILALCSISFSMAQLGTVDIIDRYQETKRIYGSVRIGDKIYVGGESLDNQYFRPTVICTDTSGTVLWNSALLGGLPYSNQTVRSLHASADGFLYGVCSTMSSNAVIKMDPLTGTVLWSTIVPDVSKLQDYGSNIACLSNGSGTYLKILNGSTGVEISSHFLRNGYLESIEVDEQLNVYYASYDTIIKRDHLNLNNAAWRVKYTAQSMNSFSRIYYDTVSGKLLGFGKTNVGQFKVLVLDTLAGAVLNTVQPAGFNNLLVDVVKVKNDDVYFATKTGSTAIDGFRLVKMHLPTATFSWTFFQNVTGNSGNNGIVDFEWDASGQVYCYGYSNSSYSNTGSHLTLLKVSPSGGLIYQKKYSFNTTLDNESDPSRCFLINSHLYLTGYMQGKKLSDLGNNNHLIQVDTLTGDSLFTAPLGGTTVNNSSEVKRIEPHPDGGFVACSRKGQLLNVQRYDSNNSLVWDVNYLKNETYAYQPVDVAIAPTGQILIGLYTTSVNTSNNLAISTTSNDLMVMLLDPNGNKLSETSFYGMVSMTASSRILDVYHDGTQFFALMLDNTGVNKQVKISMTGIPSYPVTDQVQFSFLSKQRRYFGNYSASNYMIVGNNGAFNPVTLRIFSKLDMSIQDVKVCPSYATEMHTFKEVGTSSILIGGVSTTGFEYLLLMNKLTGAILWQQTALSNASNIRVVDMEIDPTGTVVYVLSQNDGASVVRKYNLSSGTLMQTHTKPATGFSYTVNDFALNVPTNQLVVGCMRDNYANFNQEGYTYTLNTNLVETDNSVFGAGNFPQTPTVNAVHFNPNHELILGGAQPHTFAAKGVIQFASCIDTAMLNVTTCNAYLCPINNVTYTSSGTYTIYQPTSSVCDSIFTLNLTLLAPSLATQNITACDSLVWAVNGQTYNTSGQYVDTIPSVAGCDSIITLNLTIVPSQPITLTNVFVMPSDINTCLGEAAFSLAGNAPFQLNIDNGAQQVTSNGYSLITGLCPGVHDLEVTDNCGDTLVINFVVPVDSNYVFTNPFLDSLAIDSLGVIATNCDIYYNGIDTAYVDSIWATGNTVNVIWNIVDSNGSNLDTSSYVLNNGNGVYWLQLSVYCPFKALGDYFTCTVAIYFENGDIEAAGLQDYETALFRMYPNPVNDQLTLSWDEIYPAKVQVLDQRGAMIRQLELSSGSSISVRDLSPGMYFIHWSANGRSSIAKFVKQ